jgi:DNA-binding HxlR family transcriptional regulator
MEYDEVFNYYGGPSCPIDATLELISRKWVLAIIRDMNLGKKHFSEFKENKPNLNNAVLSDTLKFMEQKDLIEKIVHENNSRSNTEYVLTEKSKKLNRIIYEFVLYGVDVLNCDTDKIDNFQERIKNAYKELLEIE